MLKQVGSKSDAGLAGYIIPDVIQLFLSSYLFDILDSVKVDVFSQSVFFVRSVFDDIVIAVCFVYRCNAKAFGYIYDINSAAWFGYGVDKVKIFVKK
jgi:hypothetical protein